MRKEALIVCVMVLALFFTQTAESQEQELTVPLGEIKTSCYGDIDLSKTHLSLLEVGAECVMEEWLKENQLEVESSNQIKKAKYPTLTEGLNLIPEMPIEGFQWPYYVYIPYGYFSDSGGTTSETNKILIESVNTGTSSDDFDKPKKAAERIASGHGIAKSLNTPVVVPTYPRPRSGTINWRYYTHALDRNTLKLSDKDDELYRIDEQLVAMADHLLAALDENHDVQLEDEFFLYGFSASGNFANRFAMIHPDRVAAVAAGGVNGMPIIPLRKAKGKADHEVNLIYPVGLYDINELTDTAIDFAAYRETPQLLFMGSEDHNDTLGYGDAFGDTERNRIIEFFDTCIIDPPNHPDYEPGGKYYDDVCDNEYSKTMINRFELAKTTYAEQDLPAKFVIYKGTGHTPQPAYHDIISFFKKGNGQIDKTELVWSYNTPSGADIELNFADSVTLTFDQVGEEGNTKFSTTTKPHMVLPSELNFLNKYYISTSAAVYGDIEITINYDDADLEPAQERNLKLYKFSKDGRINNITTSNDEEANTVTGSTDSFSCFGVGYWSLNPNWNIISPPGIPVDPDPATSLGDDLQPLNLYYDYSSEGGYTAYPDDTMETQLAWRKGYWTKVNRENPADIETEVPAGNITIELIDEGWQLIGVPYSVNWSQVSFSKPPNFQTDGAGNVRLVAWSPKNELYYNHYSDSSYILSPWSGYWVKVKSAPASLTITESRSTPDSLSQRTPLPQSVNRQQLDYPPDPPSKSGQEKNLLTVVAYPNPVMEKDKLTFAVQMFEGEYIKATVTTINGKVVYDSGFKLGNKLSWDLKDSSGNKVANGVYLYKIRATDTDGNVHVSDVKRLLVLK